ncbi:MAG TPA: adenylate/guanylate cyclase domain-containing protein [Anaerolineales bacterium]|nr:adenylate/guanylate cyclase domain-containing protein [Anaerolineales bacterium]
MESLSVYVPIDRRQALRDGVALPDRLHGAGLFADISGFVPLTEELTRALGPERGVEELISHLNQIYDALIVQAERYGGSTISFGGDAFTCWFNGDDGRHATAAALAIQKAMREFAVFKIPQAGTISLSVKVAVVVGMVRRFVVGDPSIQVFDVLAGTALDRLAAAEEAAQKGEVVLDAPSWRSIRSIARERETRLRNGSQYSICDGLSVEVEPQPWAAFPADHLRDDELRPWILPPVYERLKSGQGSFIADLRPVVALFLNFGGIDYDDDPDAGVKLDRFIRRVQQILARYEGALLELTFGDKGSHLYAAFGAPLAHEDDPARAIAAAEELCLLPDEMDFIHSVRIGISRGRMRTGAYGGRTRLAYSVQGDEANLAARLMQRAGPRQILVSERIVEALSARYRFTALGVIQVKGKQGSIPAYQVLGRASSVPAPRDHVDLIGRSAECALLSGKLRLLAAEKRRGVVAIEGEAGIGKSRLLEYLQARAESLGILTFFGSGDAVEKTTPYFVWQSIFAQLFELDTLPDDAEARRRHVLAGLRAWVPADLERLAPLLNAVLPINLPENDLTAQMGGQVRLENTHALLSRILQQRAEAGPLVLALEDAHWLDSASWTLCRRIAQQGIPVLQVLATRPFPEGAPAEYRLLLDSEGAERMALGALDAQDVQALVAQNLGVKELPPAVTDFIWTKAEGNPFFSAELGYALRDRGLLLVSDGECRMAPNVDLRAAALPDTVQGVVTSRIDRLTPIQQLTLKVASVIGRVFAYRTLRDTFPVESERPLLAEQLEALTRLDLTTLEQPAPDAEYAFRHVIIQEVAYGLLLFAQRRDLHRIIAGWYERVHADELARFYGLLAYHWKRAAEPSRAIHYLEQAGDQALRQFANAEAITFLEDLPVVADEAGLEIDPERRARWELQAGEAHANLSHYKEARAHIERGFALLGAPVPQGRPRQVTGLLAELLRQAAHRAFPSRYVGRRADQRDRWLPAALAYERLGEAAYFTGDPLLSIYSEFRNLNLAEEVGPSPVMARGTAAVGATGGWVPLHGLARSYISRALNIEAAEQHLESREFVLMSAAYYYSGVGDWPRVREHGERLIATAEQLGDDRRWNDGMGILMSMHYFQGSFATSARLAQDLHAHAERRQDLRYMARGMQGRAYSELHLGHTRESLAGAQALRDMLERGQLPVLQLRMELWGILALAFLRLREYQQAVEAAQQAMSLTGRVPPTFYAAFTGYAAPAEVFLTLGEQGDRSGATIDAAHLAVQALSRYARVFLIGRPRFQLAKGRLAELGGRHRAAKQAWSTSLAYARQLGMLYDQGLALYHIAQHLPASSPARSEALQQSCQLFSELGAAYDLELARAL